MSIALQLLLMILFPLASLRIARYRRTGRWLSPVVQCYLVGIIVANFNLIAIEEPLATHTSEAAILLAIPLLLYSTDLAAWLQHARTTLLSFGICICCGLLSSAIMAFLFGAKIEQGWLLSGMIVGIYTGGIPNMQAIGYALQADEALIVLLNAADIFVGGCYLLFLTSVGPGIYARILPAFQGPTVVDEEGSYRYERYLPKLRNWTVPIVLTIGIIGISLGLSWLLTRHLHATLIVLLISAFSVLAAFTGLVKGLRGTFQIGEYFLLVFCVALGMLSDFGSIWTQGAAIIFYMGSILIMTVLLHLFLSYVLRLDRDTFMISSTAALYGPAFIGQVASVIGNRQLVFSGIAMGLIGLAIGNFLGIAVAYGLRYLLGL